MWGVGQKWYREFVPQISRDLNRRAFPNSLMVVVAYGGVSK